MKLGPNGSDHEKGQTVQGRRRQLQEGVGEEGSRPSKWTAPVLTEHGWEPEASYKRQSCLLGPL